MIEIIRIQIISEFDIKNMCKKNILSVFMFKFIKNLLHKDKDIYLLTIYVIFEIKVHHLFTNLVNRIITSIILLNLTTARIVSAY